VSPAWSPEGKQIAFLSNYAGRWEFYVMDADGTNQRKILGNFTEQLSIYYTGGNERVLSWGAQVRKLPSWGCTGDRQSYRGQGCSHPRALAGTPFLDRPPLSKRLWKPVAGARLAVPLPLL